MKQPLCVCRSFVIMLVLLLFLSVVYYIQCVRAFSPISLLFVHFTVPCRSCWFCWCCLRLLMLLEFGSVLEFIIVSAYIYIHFFFFQSPCTIHWAMPTAAKETSATVVATEAALEFKAVYFKIVVLLQKPDIAIGAIMVTTHFSLAACYSFATRLHVCIHFEPFWFFFLCTHLSYVHAQQWFTSEMDFSREISKILIKFGENKAFLRNIKKCTSKFAIKKYSHVSNL